MLSSHYTLRKSNNVTSYHRTLKTRVLKNLRERTKMLCTLCTAKQLSLPWLATKPFPRRNGQFSHLPSCHLVSWPFCLFASWPFCSLSFQLSMTAVPEPLAPRRAVTARWLAGYTWGTHTCQTHKYANTGRLFTGVCDCFARIFHLKAEFLVSNTLHWVTGQQ